MGRKVRTVPNHVSKIEHRSYSNRGSGEGGGKENDDTMGSSKEKVVKGVTELENDDKTVDDEGKFAGVKTSVGGGGGGSGGSGDGERERRRR